MFALINHGLWGVVFAPWKPLCNFLHVAESGRPGCRKVVGLRGPMAVTTSLEGFAGRAVAAVYRTVYRERVAPDRCLVWVVCDGVRVSFENSTVCRAIV